MKPKRYTLNLSPTQLANLRDLLYIATRTKSISAIEKQVENALKVEARDYLKRISKNKANH